MQKVRTFVGIPFSTGVRRELGEIQRRLSTKVERTDVKWVTPENLHVTLKFLGDVPGDRLDAVGSAVKRAAVEMTGEFELSLRGLGAFPNWRAPRIIWIGIESGREKIVNLARSVDTTLFEQGFAREKRPFSPHVTIGRVRDAADKTLVGTLLRSQTVEDKISMVVSEVHVIKSTLTRSGPIYETMATISLKGVDLG